MRGEAAADPFDDAPFCMGGSAIRRWIRDLDHAEALAGTAPAEAIQGWQTLRATDASQTAGRDQRSLEFAPRVSRVERATPWLSHSSRPEQDDTRVSVHHPVSPGHTPFPSVPSSAGRHDGRHIRACAPQGRDDQPSISFRLRRLTDCAGWATSFPLQAPCRGCRSGVMVTGGSLIHLPPPSGRTCSIS